MDSDLVQGKESRTPACGDETTPVLQGRGPLDSLSTPGPSTALFDLAVRSSRRTDRTDAAPSRSNRVMNARVNRGRAQLLNTYIAKRPYGYRPFATNESGRA